MKPKIFIGSSKESEQLAEKIKKSFGNSAQVQIWNKGFFSISDTALESLINSINEYHFAIFIFSDDDLTISREQVFKTSRDNVILEYGLFLGHYKDKKRVFILRPNVRNLKIPSDLNGLTVGFYDINKEATIKKLCLEIKKNIDRIKKTDNILAGSWFEEWSFIDEGKQKRFKDTNATIEQFGNFVTGKFKYARREYFFEGRIEQSKYLNGTWGAVKNRDSSYSGSFQLKIGIHGKKMKGKWIGFSSSDTEIRTGEWTWEKN
ncbi:MAG: nucleotide-binding protein [Ignavibacteria bacterium]|nr:nucleotide-binding protein [Ignavibacteria bacterium]